MGSTREAMTPQQWAPLRTRVIKKIGCDQRGAQRWRRQFGERLVCVRYRDCDEQQERIVTVEIVVDRWPAPPPGDEPVGVRIERHEIELRARAKEAGASFDWSRRLWVMPRRTARVLGLARRIVPGSGSSGVRAGKE